MLRERHLLTRALPLKIILVAVGTIATLIVTLFVAYSFRDLATSKLTEQIGRSAAVLADQLEYKLDSDLLERSRHLEATSRLISPLIGAERASIVGQLREARAFHDDLNWVAVFDLKGINLAESGLPPATHGKGKLPFADRLLGVIGQANVMRGSQAVLNPNEHGQDAPGHIEIATPVLNTDGLPVAALVASFNWDWAEQLGRSLGGRLPHQKETQLFVVSKDGMVLVGPTEISDEIRNVASFKEALKSPNGFKVETWRNGEQYVTGFARSQQDRFVDGEDWIVLIRQNAVSALEPVSRLQRSVIVYAILFGLHAIVIQWLLAGQIVRPLLEISQAADNLRRNGTADIPAASQFAEVNILSNSLISLVASLKARESSLESLSSSLEKQVSERTEKLAEQNRALEDAKMTAEEATLAKTRFITVASHDLRQPLQALSLFANSLSTRLAGTSTAPIAENLEQSIASLRDMFDAMLHVSRLDAGLITGELSNVGFKGLMSRMAAEFQLEAAHKGLDFRCFNRDHWIVTDPALLEVIIRNLVSNALKFTKTGGVLVGARTRNGKIVIEIFDTGPGIPEDQKNSIFREFERSKLQAIGINDGLGLGLSIAQRYAKLIGADIKVHSRLGRGTRFSIVVPKAAGAVIAESVRQQSQANLSGLHLMLLDDNAKHLESLALFLRDRGALVSTFETPETALRALRGGLVIDVAVVDYDLGGAITGVEFLDQRHEDRHDIEAIILTGRTDVEAVRAITKSGRSWISKPAEPEMIAAIIGRLAVKARPKRGENPNMAV